MKKPKAAKEAEKEKATPSPEFFSNDGSFMDRFLAMQGENRCTLVFTAIILF